MLHYIYILLNFDPSLTLLTMISTDLIGRWSTLSTIDLSVYIGESSVIPSDMTCDNLMISVRFETPSYIEAILPVLQQTPETPRTLIRHSQPLVSVSLSYWFTLTIS